MNQMPYHTNYWIWKMASGGIFVALGFVDPLAEAWKGDNSLWHWVSILVRGDYICSPATILTPIAFLALFLAVPSILTGWVVQALVVVLWSSIRTGFFLSDDISNGSDLVRRFRAK